MLFTFANLSNILEIIKDTGFRIDTTTLESFLLGKESYILLKELVVNDIAETQNIYSGQVLRNIINNNSIDIDPRFKEIKAGIFKENNFWKLYIPLET
jgi:hypothetical protein